MHVSKETAQLKETALLEPPRESHRRTGLGWGRREGRGAQGGGGVCVWGGGVNTLREDMTQTNGPG